MNSKPTISLVLPTYNGTRYLAESLQSCLDQTFQDFELIVVDDCSTDDTPRIIAEFASKDSRIVASRNEVNLRLPKSLNAGFAKARGRYLTWTSDDNLYLPNALAVMVAALEREPEVGLVYAQQTFIDKTGRRCGPSCFGAQPDALAYSNPVGACFLYRREVYEAVGDFSPDLFLVEDWDYWIRVAEKYRLRVLPDELYLYRIHDQSLSRQKLDGCRRATWQLLETHLPRMHWAPRVAKGHGHLMVARMAWRLGDRWAALRHVAWGFSYSPFYALRRFVEEPFDRLLKRRAHRRTTPDADMESGQIPQLTLNQ